ncbi:MAG TPA: DUF481 domain-containing protein [Rariglobus sp.]|nr:DUF481 domain-containing protein [Rariglobus sp.]
MFRTAGFILVVLLGARMAQAEVSSASQVLVYANGDRLQGRLIAKDGNTLIFQSVRFGELRVPADKARIVAETPAVKHTPVAKPAHDERKLAEAPDFPASMAKFLRDFFGPWSGRFAVSSQVNHDTQKHSDLLLAAKLGRKWTKDEVSLASQYDYSKTEGTVSADILKGNGMWRHTLPKRMFTVYRPAYEWNRAYKINGVNSDYVLLQQEIGGGATVVKTKNWQVRTGLSENLFDNWEDDGGVHNGTHAESIFSEADLQFPWRISLAERAVYYYAFDSGNDGWEHQLEITKKLTDTLSLGLKHEVRYNDPDVRSQDYSLLRLLLGFDF